MQDKAEECTTVKPRFEKRKLDKQMFTVASKRQKEVKVTSRGEVVQDMGKLQ